MGDWATPHAHLQGADRAFNLAAVVTLREAVNPRALFHLFRDLFRFFASADRSADSLNLVCSFLAAYQRLLIDKWDEIPFDFL